MDGVSKRNLPFVLMWLELARLCCHHEEETPMPVFVGHVAKHAVSDLETRLLEMELMIVPMRSTFLFLRASQMIHGGFDVDGISQPVISQHAVTVGEQRTPTNKRSKVATKLRE